MGGEWREIRVGDLVNQGILAISDGYRVRNEELGAEGIPFVRGGDIRDGWIDTHTEDHIRPELADRVRAKLTRPGDAAFITKGTVGRAGFLRPEQPPVVFAPQVAYWRVLDQSVLDPRFVFYLMNSHAFQSALDGVKTHGAMAADYVSISQQYDFRFRLPRVDIQRAIAHILGALDDKIDLNRRMSETLEAMARALFKSWFVDFDPVGAATGGGDPEAWRAKEVPFEAVIDFKEGPGIMASDFRTEGVPLIRLAGLEAESSLLEGCNYLDPATVQRRWNHFRLAVGDTLLSTSASLGRVVVVTREAESAIPYTGIIRMRPRNERLLPAMIPFVLRSEHFQSQVEAVGAGSVLRHFGPTHLRQMTVRIGSIERQRAFVRAMAPVLSRAQLNREQSRTLAALRDTLLPRLISGELRIPDAERIVGEVA